MELANLKQLPLNETLMAALKGASNYFDNGLSTAMLFGLSGPGFLINIQRDFAPGGPYVRRKERFYELMECLTREGSAHFPLLSQSAQRKPLLEAANDALTYAEQLLLDSERYGTDGFRLGLRAYTAWIDAVKQGHETGHGNW